jgi:hypothetical protein
LPPISRRSTMAAATMLALAAVATTIRAADATW